MARTQTINYGNAIALPVNVGTARTPATFADDGVTASTKAANELFPTRPYNRIGAYVKADAANVANLSITAPSGAIYPLAPGATISMQQGFFMEDGAYTITGTAADTFSFWEAY